MIEYVAFLRYDENTTSERINARKIAVEPIEYFTLYGETFFTCENPHTKGFVGVHKKTGFLASQPPRKKGDGNNEACRPLLFKTPEEALKAVEINVEKYVASGKTLESLIKSITDKLEYVASAFTFLDLKLKKIVQ